MARCPQGTVRNPLTFVAALSPVPIGPLPLLLTICCGPVYIADGPDHSAVHDNALSAVGVGLVIMDGRHCAWMLRGGLRGTESVLPEPSSGSSARIETHAHSPIETGIVSTD